MPLTKLDTVPALVVIDLQKGLVSFPTIQPIVDIASRAGQLAAAFRRRGFLVVLVTVNGLAPGRVDAHRPTYSFPHDWAELIPELDRQPSDLLISKQRWGAFLGTSLDADLRSRGVTQIVLAGVATSIGIESTARSAYDLGYNVVLASDAMTDLDPAAHRHSLEKIFPRLGEIDTTENLLKLFQEPLAG